MVDFRNPAQGRDAAAADRDDAADRRRADSDVRDAAADRRDVEAADREHGVREDLRELDHRLGRVRRLLLDHFARVEDAEDTALDPADWPELTPDALARLRALAAERRHLAALDRAAVVHLLDEVRDDLLRGRDGRRAAARDRRDSAQDRRDSADDRRYSARDRASSAADRGDAAVEREQVHPRGADPGR